MIWTRIQDFLPSYMDNMVHYETAMIRRRMNAHKTIVHAVISVRRLVRSRTVNGRWTCS